MICCGGICVEPWHLMLPVVLLLRPILQFFMNLLGLQPAPLPADAPVGVVEKPQSEEDFDSLVASCRVDKKKMLVDFTATWCPPCKRIAPRFAQISGLYTEKCKFVAVDVDKLSGVAGKYEVSAMPTFVLLDCGSEDPTVLDKVQGADEPSIRRMLERVFPAAGGIDDKKSQ